MKISTWTSRKCLTKSHVFSRRDFNPAIHLSSTLKIQRIAEKKGVETPQRELDSPTSYVPLYNIVVPSRLSWRAILTDEGHQLIFTSKRGDIQILIPARFSCTIHKQLITLGSPDTSLHAELKTLVGALYRSMLGVTKGYRAKLKTVGVGYKGGLEENHLIKIVLGYSHPVYYFLSPTADMKFSRKNNRFNMKGPNSSIIHQTAADLYSFKRPDVYKGKGIRYRGYKLFQKEGKKKK